MGSKRHEHVRFNSWLGKWWMVLGQVAPLLKQAGHEVIAPDLPGHGDDKTLSGKCPYSRVSIAWLRS